MFGGRGVVSVFLLVVVITVLLLLFYCFILFCVFRVGFVVGFLGVFFFFWGGGGGGGLGVICFVNAKTF